MPWDLCPSLSAVRYSISPHSYSPSRAFLGPKIPGSKAVYSGSTHSQSLPDRDSPGVSARIFIRHFMQPGTRSDPFRRPHPLFPSGFCQLGSAAFSPRCPVRAFPVSGPRKVLAVLNPSTRAPRGVIQSPDPSVSRFRPLERFRPQDTRIQLPKAVLSPPYADV